MVLVGVVTSAIAFGQKNSIENVARETSRYAATYPEPGQQLGGRQLEPNGWRRVGMSTDGTVDEVRSVLPEARIVSVQTIDVPIKYPAKVQAVTSEQSGGDAGYYLSPWRMSVANDELLALLGDERLGAALERDGIALVGVDERASMIELAGGKVSVAEVPIAVQEWSFPRVVVTEERAAQFAGFDTRDQLVVEIDLTWLDALNPFAGQPPSPVERWAGSWR